MILGWVWASVTLAIFSGWFAVTRVVMIGDLRVWDVVALRFAGGALLFLPVLLLQCLRLPARAWRDGFVLAVLWGAPFVLLVAGGLRMTSASVAASVTPGLMPLFAGGLAWWWYDQVPNRRRIAGYAVILVGVALLVLGGLSPDGQGPAGLACLVVAAFMWGAYTLFIARGTLSAVQAAAMVCFWSALFYVPLYLLSGASRLAGASWPELAFQFGYQGVLMSGIAIFAFNRAIAVLGPVAAAAVTALVPVAATLLAIPILGESPRPLGWIAIAMVAAGVSLAVRPGPAPSNSGQRSS